MKSAFKDCARWRRIATFHYARPLRGRPSSDAVYEVAIEGPGEGDRSRRPGLGLTSADWSVCGLQSDKGPLSLHCSVLVNSSLHRSRRRTAVALCPVPLVWQVHRRTRPSQLNTASSAGHHINPTIIQV
jgi:hypothetical protein